MHLYDKQLKGSAALEVRGEVQSKSIKESCAESPDCDIVQDTGYTGASPVL